ncbi:MAG: hypothetical protein CM1200mP30_05180 [Pseudomonadota bacterium]|nr:MAG: hypothetical protein CM1200mP30_05180 [Pseudomonadota bacterium]
MVTEYKLLDWAMAENMAYATLLSQNCNVRLRDKIQGEVHLHSDMLSLRQRTTQNTYP